MKVVFLLLIFASNACAFGEYSVGIGVTSEGERVCRLGVNKNISDVFHFEAGLNVVEGDILSISGAPMVRLGGVAFFELGIGVGFFSETETENRDLSTRFLFEDKIGVGFDFDAATIVLQVVHYSNCSIKPPNDGLDMIVLKLRREF